MSADFQQHSAALPEQPQLPTHLPPDLVFPSSTPLTQELLLSIAGGHLEHPSAAKPPEVSPNGAELHHAALIADTATFLATSGPLRVVEEQAKKPKRRVQSAPGADGQPAKRKRVPKAHFVQNGQQLAAAAQPSADADAAPGAPSQPSAVHAQPLVASSAVHAQPSAASSAAEVQLHAASSAAAGEADGVSGDANSMPHRRRPQNAIPTRVCAMKDCRVQPSYNYPGEKKRLFCSTHRAEGMINLCNKRCAQAGCTVSPRFNLPSCTSGKFCNVHKLPGMINVTDRRCEHEGCTKHPTYNYPGTHKRLYCAVHKLEGMQDMSH